MVIQINQLDQFGLKTFGLHLIQAAGLKTLQVDRRSFAVPASSGDDGDQFIFQRQPKGTVVFLRLATSGRLATSVLRSRFGSCREISTPSLVLTRSGSTVSVP